MTPVVSLRKPVWAMLPRLPVPVTAIVPVLSKSTAACWASPVNWSVPALTSWWPPAWRKFMPACTFAKPAGKFSLNVVVAGSPPVSGRPG